MTQQPKENIIPPTRSGAPQGGRHQIGTPAGFGSEQVAGFADVYGHLFPSGDDEAELAAAERALLG